MHSKRIDHLAAWLSPLQRLMMMLGPLLALVVVDNLVPALGLLFLTWVLAQMAGKRVNLFYFTLLALSIVGFALLNPMGRVIWDLGWLRLTQGALEEGLLKATRLIGMVFASLAGIHRDLRLPGRLGRFWALVLSYYESLLNLRKRVTVKHWVESLDEVFEEVFPTNSSNPNEPSKEEAPITHHPGWAGWLVVLMVWGMSLVILIWGGSLSR